MQEIRKVHGARSKDTTKEFYGGVSAGLGEDVAHDLAGVAPAETRRGAVYQGAKKGLYGVTHKYAEDMIRRATLHHAIKRTPEYWEARGTGLSHQQAFAEVSKLESVRGQMRTAVNNVLGDYNYLNKAEQKIKRVIPFYTWDRAIAHHTFELAKNRPYQGAVIVPIGRGGVAETRERLGHIPAFMDGAIPLGDHGFLLGGAAKGRTNVLTTQGLNPYATVGEEADLVGSVLGLKSGSRDVRVGEALGGQLNPLLGGAAEYLSGHSLLSGAELPHRPGGLPGNIYGSLAESVPQTKLLEALIRGPKKGKDPKHPLLFPSDTRQQLSGFLGAPEKEMSGYTANELYRRERGLRKKYRTRHSKSLVSSAPDNPAY